MQTTTTVGLDIAKSVFQVHCVVVRRQLKRRYVLTFFQNLPSCLVASRLVHHRIIGRVNFKRSVIPCA